MGACSSGRGLNGVKKGVNGGRESSIVCPVQKPGGEGEKKERGGAEAGEN